MSNDAQWSLSLPVVKMDGKGDWKAMSLMYGSLINSSVKLTEP